VTFSQGLRDRQGSQAGSASGDRRGPGHHPKPGRTILPRQRLTWTNERYRGENFRRQRSQELKAGLPVPEFPKNTKIGIKTLGYLYAYCRLRPEDIAAKFPKALTLADVFLGLSHYLTDRERYDAEIQKERAFNSAAGLESSTAALPKVGLSSLVDLAKG
jgi:hypothetical protein